MLKMTFFKCKFFFYELCYTNIQICKTFYKQCIHGYFMMMMSCWLHIMCLYLWQIFKSRLVQHSFSYLRSLTLFYLPCQPLYPTKVHWLWMSIHWIFVCICCLSVLTYDIFHFNTSTNSLAR